MGHRLQLVAIASALFATALPTVPATAAPQTEVSSQLRAPKPLSASFDARRKKLLAALRPELQPQLDEVVAAAIVLATNGGGGVHGHTPAEGDDTHDGGGAIKTAVLQADFASVSKHDDAVMHAVLALATLQTIHLLNFRLRGAVSHGLAIRAVLACKGSISCIDGLVASGDMQASDLDAVRSKFNDKLTKLDAEDKRNDVEVRRLQAAYTELQLLSATIAKKQDDTNAGVLRKL